MQSPGLTLISLSKINNLFSGYFKFKVTCCRLLWWLIRFGMCTGLECYFKSNRIAGGGAGAITCDAGVVVTVAGVVVTVVGVVVTVAGVVVTVVVCRWWGCWCYYM